MGERRTRVDNTSLSDAELLYRLRSGHNDAYGELWNRHSKAGISVARSVTSSLDPDDLVSEAFAKILTTIKRGNGPEGAFRPYLYTTIRNVAATWGGRQRESTTLHEIEMHLEDPRFSEESTVAGLDRALILTAFKSLNPRWQEVLWYLEVEAMKPADIAPLLGMKPTAVSMLGSRAREGLRKAWIEAHISNVPDESECQWVFGHLGARARGTLKPKDRARMEAHLDEHEQCRTIAAEAETVGSRLAVAILPVVLGVGGAAALLAQESAHPAAASAPARHVTEATRLTPTWIAAAAVTAVVAVASAAIALAAPHAGHPGSSGPRHAQTDLATPDLGEQAPPPVEIKVSPSAPQSDPVPSSPQPYPVMPPLKVSPEAPLMAPTDPPDPSVLPKVAVPPESAKFPELVTPLEIPAPLVAVRPPRLEAPSLTSVDTADGLYFPMLSGSAEPGAAITVSNGPLPDVVVAAASDGTWSTPQLEGLPAGRSTIDVAQTLRGATSATTTATVDLVPPTIVASRGALVNGLFPLPITGHPGAHVTVLIEGSSSAQATLDATGGATVSIPFASGQAPLTMTARYGAPGRSGPSSGRMSLTLDLTG